MKNKLSDLKDHLFAQLERLSDENLTPEQIEHEAKRCEAMVSVSDQMLKMAALQIQAARIAHESGSSPVPYLPAPAGALPVKTAPAPKLAAFPPYKEATE